VAPEERKPLGKILLKQKLITPQQLEEHLRAQSTDSTRPLASRLTSAGIISETDALRALSEQFGVPGIDLRQIAILLEHLDLVPKEICDAQQILPVLVRDDRIFLAMTNPNDSRAIDELEFVTGKKVYPYVAISSTLMETTRKAFEAKDDNQTYFLGNEVPEDTLRQLGLEKRTDAENAPPVPSSIPSVRSIPPPQPTPSVHGGAMVVDQRIEEASHASELDNEEFGNMSADVSAIVMLPEELKVARGAQHTDHTIEKNPDGQLILVVDDEEDIRKLLRRLLSDRGYRVVEADRGLLALRMVKETPPDLIILDAMLPELHGFDIARRIKGSERYGKIPIIMVSAVYRGWRIAEDLKASYGIEEYLEKPFRIADVMNAVTKLLTRHTSPTLPPPRDPEAANGDAERALEEGIAAYRAGDVEKAIAHLKRGVQIDPLAYRLRYHLALLYGRRGQFYDGINELERAVDLNPSHFPALKNLAVLYEKAGFKHKAIEMWERCVKYAADDATRVSIKEHLLKLL
jgi:DNA-binding response OmpR family regulator